MASTTADDRAATLPEDILFEIFSRVQNVRDILCCALACKPWLRPLTDRNFLRRLWPDHGHGHPSSRLLGFFIQKQRLRVGKKGIKRHTRERYSVSAPTFVPTPAGSRLGPPGGGEDRALTALVADDGGAFNYAEPVASRDGVVLMRLVPRTYHEMKAGLLLGLCNPITGERHVAQLLDCDCACLGRYVDGYAIFVDAEDDGDLIRSPSVAGGRSAISRTKLLVTCYNRQGDSHLHLHSYSTATRSWSAPTRSLNGDSYHRVGATAAVVHRGRAHWLYAAQGNRGLRYILSSDATATRVSFTKLPVYFGRSPFLCVGEGDRLSIASIASVIAMHMDVWTQQDGGDHGDHSAWLCTQVIQIPPQVQLSNDSSHRCEWFPFNMGSLLALYDGHRSAIFVLDIERKVLDKVMRCPSCLFTNGYGTCVPLVVDLSEFFMLQLGGLSRG